MMSHVKCANGTLPRIDVLATGEQINRLRLAQEISVKDIQHVFGFTTPNAVYKWINGKNLPTIDNLVILADIFKTTIDDIICTENNFRREENEHIGSRNQYHLQAPEERYTCA